MGRTLRITRALQRHDRELYCDENKEGTLCVYRKSFRLEHFEVDGVAITSVRPAPHFIFALTDDWTAKGKPADWGLEPILARIRAIDLWNNETMVDRLVKDLEDDAKASERKRRNDVESFLLDFRRQFARTFNDVNTSTLSKTDLRRTHGN